MRVNKFCIAVLSITLALPVTAYSADRIPPPGAMQDGAYMRAELVKANVEMCAGAGLSQALYKELQVGETRTQFCQCTYDNYFAKFSNEEIISEIGLTRKNLKRLGNLTDKEKNDITIKAERNKKRLAQSEIDCMNKMKVSVTPASK